MYITKTIKITVHATAADWQLYDTGTVALLKIIAHEPQLAVKAIHGA